MLNNELAYSLLLTKELACQKKKKITYLKALESENLKDNLFAFFPFTCVCLLTTEMNRKLAGR